MSKKSKKTESVVCDQGHYGFELPVEEIKVETPKKESKKKLFIIDTISTFRLRYAIEAESLEHAYDEVTMNGGDDFFDELSQKHLGETIIDGREISKDDLKKMTDKLQNNPEELCCGWMGDKLIRKIDYNK